ncbi:hypothetical protein Scep_029728 [Stephania cephalantha]|uniref:Uncharacterized protein n=1 Tax=Stephania cephalantha TaxID=152367 RepID=A0AAP0E1V6_9MAGN
MKSHHQCPIQIATTTTPQSQLVSTSTSEITGLDNQLSKSTGVSTYAEMGQCETSECLMKFPNEDSNNSKEILGPYEEVEFDLLFPDDALSDSL